MTEISSGALKMLIMMGVVFLVFPMFVTAFAAPMADSSIYSGVPSWISNQDLGIVSAAQINLSRSGTPYPFTASFENLSGGNWLISWQYEGGTMLLGGLFSDDDGDIQGFAAAMNRFSGSLYWWYTYPNGTRIRPNVRQILGTDVIACYNAAINASKFQVSTADGTQWIYVFFIPMAGYTSMLASLNAGNVTIWAGATSQSTANSDWYSTAASFVGNFFGMVTFQNPYGFPDALNAIVSIFTWMGICIWIVIIIAFLQGWL